MPARSWEYEPYEYINHESECAKGIENFADAFDVLEKFRNKKIPDSQRDTVKKSLDESNNWYFLAVNALQQLIYDIDGNLEKNYAKKLKSFWRGVINKMEKSGLNHDKIERIKKTIGRLNTALTIVKENIDSQAKITPNLLEGSDVASVNFNKELKKSIANSPLTNTGDIGVLAVENSIDNLEIPSVNFEHAGKKILIKVSPDFTSDKDESAYGFELTDQPLGTDQLLYLTINVNSFDRDSGLPKVKKISQAMSAQVKELIK